MMPFPIPMDLGAFVIGASAALVALLVLVRIAGRLGLADDGSDAPERKAQRGAVPLVGGPALVLAAIALASWPRFWSTWDLVPWITLNPWSFTDASIAVAAALAFLTGLVDDVRAAGLRPRAKLVGQIGAGIALAAGLQNPGDPPGLLERALVVFVAVAAQNIANTFDHADGTLSGVAGAAFACAGSGFTGALAVFLGFNVARRRPGAPPYAYLGDSGSHLIGILLCTTTLGLAALTLPALDLARVVYLRRRAGQPVWHGDRRHLGQRIQAAGEGPIGVLALVLLCAAPPFVALWLSIEREALPLAAALAIGAVGSGLLLALVLHFHPEPAPHAD